jgi:hypothetical protein
MRSRMVRMALAFVALCLSASAARGANLSGRVFEDLDGNGVLDAGEPCVSSVVSLRADLEGPEQISVVQCGGGGPGTYYFGSLRPGEYLLAVRQTSPGDFSTPSVTVSIPAEEELVPFVLRDLPVRRLEPSTSPGDPNPAVNTIQGSVTRKDGNQNLPLTGAVVTLQDDASSLMRLTSTNAEGQYRFEKLTRGVYRVAAADPPGAPAGDAFPGPNAIRIDANTLRVTMLPGVTLYGENNFVKSASLPPGRLERLRAVGDPVPARGRLGIFQTDPLTLDRDVSIIRRVEEDGALFIVDYAGTALFRLGSGRAENLLDTTLLDPTDPVGLARLLRVEPARLGAVAVLALRADNRRGIYRLDRSDLTRLALQEATDPLELAISDAGQVAYVARSAGGGLTLFQAAPGRSGEPVRLDPVVDVANSNALGISNLQSNGAGDLVFRVEFPRADGALDAVVLRKTSARLEGVAYVQEPVQPGLGAGVNARLTELRRPRIGPDSTVVFMGAGDGFTNFYVARPGRAPEPLLPGLDWKRDHATFDYEIAPDGAIALRATPGAAAASTLFLVGPDGLVRPVRLVSPDTGRRLQPQGRPVFTEGRLFFLAADPGMPPDRNGRPPVGLYRVYRSGGNPTGGPEPVAVFGQPVPGLAGARLLGVTQRPEVSTREVVFGALFSGGERFPVPTPGLFRVPLDGKLEDGLLAAAEGIELPRADRVANFREVYFTADGSLVLDSLLPGAGPLVDTLPPVAATSGGFRPQSVQADLAPPLLVTGTDLGSGRRLEALLGPLVSLPPDRERFLFTARFSQNGLHGEGLFTIDTSQQVQVVAVTGSAAPGLPGAIFRGFGDQTAYSLGPPSVSTDGHVVFKALAEQNQARIFRVFQWRQPDAIATLVGPTISEPDRDDLLRWAAGPSGRAYYLERYTTPSGTGTRLFTGSSAGPLPLVVPGQTTIGDAGAGTSPTPTLTTLSDFVVNGAGEVFLQGAKGAGTGATQETGLFRVEPVQTAAEPTRVAPVVSQGQSVPLMAGGTALPGLVFGGSFTLRRNSACGDLYFEADLLKPGVSGSRTTGLFRRNAQGVVETLLTQSLEAGSERHVTLVVIPPDVECNRVSGAFGTSQTRQTASGTTAFATYNETDGWVIYRLRAGGYTLVAKAGQELPGGTRLVSLDAGSLLGLAPGYGPLFTLNDAGDVAFLATDGQRWAVYRFSDSQTPVASG